MPLDSYRGCIECFCSFVQSYIEYQFMQHYQTANKPITVTFRHATMCITFYPSQHDRPILIHDGAEVYIVPERIIPSHWIDNSDNEDESSLDAMEIASLASSAPTTASCMAICKKDPTIEDVGDP
jgi:hypothetical protein